LGIVKPQELLFEELGWQEGPIFQERKVKADWRGLPFGNL